MACPSGCAGGMCSGITSPGPVVLGAGGYHTCAVVAGGGLKCWGDNSAGQLGNNSTMGSLIPVEVTGLSSGVLAVAAGGDDTCAVTAAGALKCWGDNSSGQLGNDSTMDSVVPVEVTGLSSGVLAVSAGGGHTCAVTSAGAVKCWGRNDVGQLGNDSTMDSVVPVDVTGLSSGVVAVSAGGYHTCAVTSAGAVKCWGYNGWGQLGNSSTADSPVPVDVTGLSSGVLSVSGGARHTCVVTSAGAVECWGDNQFGELGDGSVDGSPVPVDVTGLFSGVLAVSAGESHTCAVTAAGAVESWGNEFGWNGNDSMMTSVVPVDIKGLSSGVLAISAGVSHSCAITTAGAVKCWGHNDHGQLGDDSTNDSSVAVDVVGL